MSAAAEVPVWQKDRNLALHALVDALLDEGVIGFDFRIYKGMDGRTFVAVSRNEDVRLGVRADAGELTWTRYERERPPYVQVEGWTP